MIILLCVLGYVAFWIVTRPVFFLCYAYFFRHPYSQYDFEFAAPRESLAVPIMGEAIFLLMIVASCLNYIINEFDDIEKKVSESRKHIEKKDVVDYLESLAAQDPELLRQAIEEVDCL